MSNPFYALARNPLKFRLFLLTKLPSAFFSGVRLREINEEKCVVSVPCKWFSRNPFRSTYFACLAMAAEMSTGALAMACLYKRKPAVSMLVLNVQGEYLKKAVRRTLFTCHAGREFRECVEKAVSSGEPQTLTATSTGQDDEGNIIANFTITWSFKARI